MVSNGEARKFKEPEQHYTAVIEIVHSTPEQVIKNSYNDTKTVPKEKREIARIVVRDKDLDKLTQKVASHLELVEDN